MKIIQTDLILFFIIVQFEKFQTFLRLHTYYGHNFTDKESLLYHSMQSHPNAFPTKVPILLYPLKTPENLGQKCVNKPNNSACKV